MENKIYTHDEAARIVDIFEKVLEDNNICVPSPEDDERGEDNMVGLYGTVYGELLDEVEDRLIDILLSLCPIKSLKHSYMNMDIHHDKSITKVITGVFSGNA